jgi:zinc finger protein
LENISGPQLQKAMAVSVSNANGTTWKKASEDDVCVISDCYCPNCHESHAITNLLPTDIPFFREVILLSLYCPSCHFRNSEVTPGGEIQGQGARLTLKVTQPIDLERQLVKSPTATMILPHLEFEIPPRTQRGTISTLEGILKRAATNLEALQPERLTLGDMDNFYRCQSVIEKLRESASWDASNEKPFHPFDIILDDPAGNSFIENFQAPKKDPCITCSKYVRTPTQDMALGLQPSQAAYDAGSIDDNSPNHKNKVSGLGLTEEVLTVETDVSSWMESQNSVNHLGKQEVMSFPGPCPNCQESAETNMCKINIPNFKEAILMNLLCGACGYRSNEIKVGGPICQHATKITLIIRSEEDLKREVLLSNTAGISIPEIELELEDGGLGGIYTTVEGLLKRLLAQLKAANPFACGDASEPHTKNLNNNHGDELFANEPLHGKFRNFLAKLAEIGEARVFPVTLIVNDPLSNSFIGPAHLDPLPSSLLPISGCSLAGKTDCSDEGDTLIIEVYERSWEQNEILGLIDLQADIY